MRINEIDAYAAGLFDGEGHVSIQAKRYAGRRNCTTMASITMTDPEPIRLLYATYQGTWCKPNRVTRSGKQIYRWCAAGDSARHFAERILPYSILKRPQLEMLLMVRKTFGIALTDEVWEQRVQLARKLKEIRAT